jgi:hypothetical protein
MLGKIVILGKVLIRPRAVVAVIPCLIFKGSKVCLVSGHTLVVEETPKQVEEWLKKQTAREKVCRTYPTSLNPIDLIK